MPRHLGYDIGIFSGGHSSARAARVSPCAWCCNASFRRSFQRCQSFGGATVYDGDRLSTESEGLLQFRGAGSLLYLPGQRGITLHRLPASSFPQRGTIDAMHENKKVKIVIMVLIGWATEWAVHKVLESPDRP